MKKLLNTLYVLTPSSYLHYSNEAVVVEVGGEEKVRIPAHTLESILCFGMMTVSTPLMAFCSERGISLSFLSEQGRFWGQVHGKLSGNVLLRRQQHAALEDRQQTLILARGFLLGKLANSRTTLLRSRREANDEPVRERLAAAAQQQAKLASEMKQTVSIEALRGVEGAAASGYFSVLDDMVRTDDPFWKFDTRSRRPAENAMNALLSFTYALLRNDMVSALNSVGFDPAVGYLHALRPGRPALALDMMEELRSSLCDRFVLTLINRKQLGKQDFDHHASEFLLTDKARKIVLTEWQTRKHDTLEHPFLHEQIPIGLIPFLQAKLLAHTFRGDVDGYPPFHWR